MYSRVIVAPPAQYDGHLLARHVLSVTGHNVFRRLSLSSASMLEFCTEGFPVGADLAIIAAVDTYVHPVDVSAERTLLDIAMGV